MLLSQLPKSHTNPQSPPACTLSLAASRKLCSCSSPKVSESGSGASEPGAGFISFIVGSSNNKKSNGSLKQSIGSNTFFKTCSNTAEHSSNQPIFVHVFCWMLAVFCLLILRNELGLPSCAPELSFLHGTNLRSKEYDDICTFDCFFGDFFYGSPFRQVS